MKAGEGRPDVFLSTEDIGEILQLSARTVRTLLVQGKLCKFIHVGRSIRVRREEFDKWTAQQEADAMAPGVQWVGD